MNRLQLVIFVLGLPLTVGCADAGPSSVSGTTGVAGDPSSAAAGATAAGGATASINAGTSGVGGGVMHGAGETDRAGFGGLASAGGGGAGGSTGNVATSGAGPGGGTGPNGPAQVRAGCETVEHDGHTYSLCRDRKLAFPAARTDCVSMNMQLIRLDSAAESDWVYTTFYSKPATPGGDSSQMWVGGTDTGVEGEWRWLIGADVFWTGKADGMPVAGLYTYWGRAHAIGVQDQPNDSHPPEGEDCMVIRGPTENEGGKWTDISCADENKPPALDTRIAWYTCESGP